MLVIYALKLFLKKFFKLYKWLGYNFYIANKILMITLGTTIILNK